jgi:hypothetical protein
MANEEHLKLLNQGTEVWNLWREKNPFLVPDLNYANLDNANLGRFNLSTCSMEGVSLRYVSLRLANMSHTNLHKADLYFTDLFSANLVNLNLTDSNLIGVFLSGADLRNARFCNARLRYATIFDCLLKGADFLGAQISESIFANVDLSVARGLDEVKHEGPSTIGIDTLLKSAGKIPEVFLSGCGVPDDFITYFPSLIGARNAIHYYSCFISYSSEDEDFAKRLHSRMRDAHLRVWFAPEDIKAGEKIYEQLENAIQMNDRLLLVLSEHSINSEWVIAEIKRALKVERKENRRKLFPILVVDFNTIKKWELIDTDTGRDLAIEIRSYFMPDFSDWKDHDAFEVAFARLLKDLRTVV